MTTKFTANEEVLELLSELKRVRDHKDKVIEQEKYVTQRLYNLVNEHEEIVSIDEHGISKVVATWKYSKDSERFDSKSFKEAHPVTYNEYVKITPGSRTLRIAK